MAKLEVRALIKKYFEEADMPYKEYFRDRIKPPAPPEFEIGDCITPERLAAYINKPNLAPENFGCSGRSTRVGNYMLDRQTWGIHADTAYLKFVLSNYSHQGECTENGIIECRQYWFIEEDDHLKCVSYNNSMLGFYDQMTLDGDSIQIYV